MSYNLQKPYTEKQKADFIVKYNHNKGLLINETDTALYALEVNEIMGEDNTPVINPRYEAEQAQKEAERIALLNLTAADVERAIYKAKGIDFDDIITMIEAMPLSEGQEPQIDIKALKIELKANNFYRGNPYIDTVGTLLGFTKQQLDEFFETNDYTKLLPPAEEDTSSPSGISGVSPNAPEENEGVNNEVNDSEAPETPAAPTSDGETEEVEE